MRYTSLGTVGLSLLVVLAACGTDADEMREIRDGQRQILVKLAELEKKIDQGGARPAAGPAAAAVDPNKVYSLAAGSSPAKGPANAPVTIVEFADFQCPFCAKVPAVIDEVLKAYPNDVRFVYKQLPLPMHPNAMNASRAALAANKQGKYWPMYEKLFENQRALDTESLKKYAQEVGLDMAQFEKDVASPEIQKQIDEEVNLAKASQVNGTPTLFVNGKRVIDRSVVGLKKLVDDALKAKS
ncbi:MAG: DsbA family protein [Candidatus Binatia bacterium]